jgi:hypothetical protein
MYKEIPVKVILINGLMQKDEIKLNTLPKVRKKNL